MSQRVLLDTHVLVWWVSAAERLSQAAARAIDLASEVVLSAASAWEIALLVEARRIALDRDVGAWFAAVSTRERVSVRPLDDQLVVASVALGRRGFHRDPADRFLYAMAARDSLPLVTKDEAISRFAQGDGVPIVW